MSRLLDSRLPPRFWAKVTVNETAGCWEWTGCTDRGYGHFRFGGKVRKAYRVAYEFQRINTLRGDTLQAANVTKTACPRGHHYDESNTRLYRGKRYCRECQRVWNREAYKRHYVKAGTMETVKALKAMEALRPIDTDGEEK